MLKKKTVWSSGRLHKCVVSRKSRLGDYLLFFLEACFRLNQICLLTNVGVAVGVGHDLMTFLMSFTDYKINSLTGTTKSKGKCVFIP